MDRKNRKRKAVRGEIEEGLHSPNLKRPIYDHAEDEEQQEHQYSTHYEQEHNAEQFEEVPVVTEDANGHPTADQNMIGPQQAVISKYWAQRYRLFSKYSEGIVLDEEGWYSATPELIAAHLAERIWKSLNAPQAAPSKSHRSKKAFLAPRKSHSSSLLLDPFCGPGGNVIQFAKSAPPGGLVFALDINPNRIYMAKHNATIYGVQDRVEFIIGDSLKLSPKFRVDAIFLSPPWGGPEYINSDYYDLSNIQPIHGSAMFHLFRTISPNIGYLLPRNTKQAQLIQLADKGSKVEIEGHYLAEKLKMLTAFYGSLANTQDEAQVLPGRDESDVVELPWIHKVEEEEPNQEEE
jgi:trimethylguanosine synthase